MPFQKMMGCVCVLAGIVACLSGMDSVLRAEPLCQVAEGISPAICIPAHQEPPRANPWIPDDGAGCVNYYYLFCWPDPEIGCWTEGFGQAIWGECEHYLGESPTEICFDDYNETEVVLQHHRSECEFYEAVCECIWIIGGQSSISFTVCNCGAI